VPGYNPNHPVNRGREPARRPTALERVLTVVALMWGGWFLVAVLIGAGHSVREFFQ
jgi:hypothetical protein